MHHELESKEFTLEKMYATPCEVGAKDLNV